MTKDEMEAKIQEAESTLKNGFCSKGFSLDYENAVGLAKRANAIFMVDVDWGENYEADEEMLAEELDRIFCIMNDEEWDSLIRHPGLGHSFKGGLPLARQNMQGKPVGTRSVFWQCQINLPKAIIPRCQAALDEYTKNETWRCDYVEAPRCVKIMRELGYYCAWYEKHHGHEPEGDEAAELARISKENSAKMKKADFLYLADHCYGTMAQALARPRFLQAAERCKE